MCDERQCKRQPANAYSHCEDHHQQMSIAGCKPKADARYAARRKKILQGWAKIPAAPSPEADPKRYMSQGKTYDWEGTGPRLHTNTADNDNNMAQGIDLTEEQIADAIKQNHALIAKYHSKKKNQATEKLRIFQSVGSSSEDFDHDSILAIAKWQAKHNLPPTGIYDSACRKLDLELTEAVAWNDEHFKTKDDPQGLKTWHILATKLNVPISDDITPDEKKSVVEALKKQQSKWKGATVDGHYGIKNMKKLESNLPPFNIHDVDFEKRQQNIESFLASSNSAFQKGPQDPKYTHRHARYLTEFMNLSDSNDHKTGNEQIPFDLVRRMILDDLCNNKHENIGLLALWIGTAKWGVSGLGKRITDPAGIDWQGPPSGGGKRIREYEQGGVGIADYDVEKLADFYKVFLNDKSPDVAPDSKRKLLSTPNKATKYDDIKSYRAFYEIMSALFDRNRGVAGDEWNDKASIWLMENWLDTTWDSAQARMPNDPKAAIFSRMQNSLHIPINGSSKTYNTSYKQNFTFKKIDSGSPVTLMEEQYGDCGALFYPKKGKTDQEMHDTYIKRLQYPKRIMKLQEHVKETYYDQKFKISEDGATILDPNGNPIR